MLGECTVGMEKVAAEAHESSEKSKSPAQMPATIDMPMAHLIRHGLMESGVSPPVSTETTLGRISMVAAVLFFSVEFSSGMSIPDQCSAIMRHFVA